MCRNMLTYIVILNRFFHILLFAKFNTIGICWLLYNVLLNDTHHNIIMEVLAFIQCIIEWYSSQYYNGSLTWISTNVTNIYLTNIRFETLQYLCNTLYKSQCILEVLDFLPYILSFFKLCILLFQDESPKVFLFLAFVDCTSHYN